jgi:hypothetical protein
VDGCYLIIGENGRIEKNKLGDFKGILFVRGKGFDEY